MKPAGFVHPRTVIPRRWTLVAGLASVGFVSCGHTRPLASTTQPSVTMASEAVGPESRSIAVSSTTSSEPPSGVASDRGASQAAVTVTTAVRPVVRRATPAGAPSTTAAVPTTSSSSVPAPSCRSSDVVATTVVDQTSYGPTATVRVTVMVTNTSDHVCDRPYTYGGKTHAQDQYL